MPKCNTTPRVGTSDSLLQRELREHATQINLMAEGRQSAFYQARTAVPTTETWAQGDFVLNSAPSELGGAGSKYIIHGWRCVASGTPGTWVQCRFLTGN